MRHYIVQITDKALADMEEIYDYIAIQLQATENAMGQYNRIAEAIERLAVFPKCVRVMESEPECFIVLPILAGVYWKIRKLLFLAKGKILWEKGTKLYDR